jgi:toxin CcdB
MALFQVYRLKDSDLLVLDLQTDFLDSLPSKVVVPLHSAGEMNWAATSLNPRFLINDQLYVMATRRMASVPVSEIGQAIADLSGKADAIIAATDFLFQGF